MITLTHAAAVEPIVLSRIGTVCTLWAFSVDRIYVARLPTLGWTANASSSHVVTSSVREARAARHELCIVDWAFLLAADASVVCVAQLACSALPVTGVITLSTYTLGVGVTRPVTVADEGRVAAWRWAHEITGSASPDT
jgi:hypothetical protein